MINGKNVGDVRSVGNVGNVLVVGGVGNVGVVGDVKPISPTSEAIHHFHSTIQLFHYLKFNISLFINPTYE